MYHEYEYRSNTKLNINKNDFSLSMFIVLDRLRPQHLYLNVTGHVLINKGKLILKEKKLKSQEDISFSVDL